MNKTDDNKKNSRSLKTVEGFASFQNFCAIWVLSIWMTSMIPAVFCMDRKALCSIVRNTAYWEVYPNLYTR